MSDSSYGKGSILPRDDLSDRQVCIRWRRTSISSTSPGGKNGTSTALALTTAPMLSNVGGVSYALNAAMYRGEQAIGLSFAYRANTENPFAVTGGVSYAGGDSDGARVGIAGEF